MNEEKVEFRDNLHFSIKIQSIENILFIGIKH